MRNAYSPTGKRPHSWPQRYRRQLHCNQLISEICKLVSILIDSRKMRHKI